MEEDLSAVTADTEDVMRPTALSVLRDEYVVFLLSGV